MNFRKVLPLIICLFAIQSILAKDFYVSTTGNDNNKGSKKAPFLTIEKARFAVQDLIQKGLKENITVQIMSGTYTLTETVVFGLEDSPNENYTVTYQAYKNEEVVISSGQPVSAWIKATNVDGMPEIAKGNVWVADMPENVETFRTLFDGDSRLTRARGADFKMPLKKEIRRADSQNTYYHKDRIHLRMVPYPNEEIKDWDNLSDVEVVFNPVPWNLNLIQLESVDVENKVGYLAFEANSMPFTNSKHSIAWVENVIDYLDEPGEWCVNTKTRKIYYWPKSGTPSKDIEVPKLMELFKVEGNIQYDLPNDIPVKNINFKGLTFTKGDRSVWYKNRKGWGIQHDWDTFDYGNALLRFRGAENCKVTECRFTNSGGSAMRLDLHAQNIEITNNYIDYVGHMGILLAGYGPGTKDVNKNNTIENNILHHVGQVIWHGHAIFAWQSGENKIANNYIHDVPRKAIGLCGVRAQILMKPDDNFDEASRTIRWHDIERTIDSTLTPQRRYAPYLHARNNVVEYNRAERTLLKLSDGSSINISGAGTGNMIRHNYIYDVPHVGFRTDDWQEGTTLMNNIVHKSGNSAFIHKGINTIKNNIIIDCARGIHFRAYPQQYFIPESDITNNIIYSTSEKFVPNTVFKWGKMFVHVAGTKSMPYEYNMDYNNYWWPGAKEDLELKRKNGIEAHGVMMDPQFKDLENFDYIIQNKEMIEATGFKPFDVSIESFGVSEDYPEHFRKLDPTLNK
ncbi:MAG: right-handed parallel beta-helix repeat-containing protein [Urechidicola sp.]|nr:right-handed parallel beta-helix repeat-containing protein [Urechidicola sp.]